MSGWGDGRWVEVAQPGAAVRWDWRPTLQPPSPDGAPGAWHLVTAVGPYPSRWEWIPDTTDAPPSALASQAWASGFSELARVTAETIGTGASDGGRPRIRPGTRRALRRALAGGGLALVVVAGAVMGIRALSADDEARTIGGRSGSAPSPTPGSGQDDRTPARPAPSLGDPSEASSRAPEEPGQDIASTLGQFRIVDDGPRGRRGSLEVSFTNRGVATSHFRATIEAVGASGAAPIATDTAWIQDLAPGQSRVVSVFADLPTDRFQAVAAAEIRVVSYQPIAPIRSYPGARLSIHGLLTIRRAAWSCCGE
jgi:hypothetical protein